VSIDIPELCLLVLIGPAGAGKSTFARARFRPTEVVSSDACRAMVADGSALVVRGDRDAGEEAPSHLVLAGGRLVVAHAGIRSEYVGRDSPRVTVFCLHGEAGWQDAYRGRALVVHGHEPVTCPTWRGRTVNVNTTGALTALRFPELELVSVPA
jgi:hypothetical protein